MGFGPPGGTPCAVRGGQARTPLLSAGHHWSGVGYERTEGRQCGKGRGPLPVPARDVLRVTAAVAGVSRCAAHAFSKDVQGGIRLLVGLGVEGDAHLGVLVRHRSRVARDLTAPNLRQLHVLHAELLAELGAAGFTVPPGAMGENVLTSGLDLLGLPCGARLRLGAEAVAEVTGLRNPCAQLNRFQPGLMAAVLGRDADGQLVRKAGIMAVVVVGGWVRLGDPIAVELPAGPYRRLEPV